MKKFMSVLLAITMCFGLVACSGNVKEAAEKDSTEVHEEAVVESEDKNGIRVCVVYSGNLGDKSYNDSCNIGAEKAKSDFGIELKSLEGTTAEEWEANFVAACEEGYDLIICSSSNFDDYLKKHGPNYPDIRIKTEVVWVI